MLVLYKLKIVYFIQFEQNRDKLLQSFKHFLSMFKVIHSLGC